MNLYKSTDRFLKNFNILKNKLNRKPSIEELASFDHLHYDGVKTVNIAINKTHIDKESIVLDIGSGIGGPARYIAYKTSAKVFAIELQEDLNDIARKITSIYKLEKFVKHIEGNILKVELKKNSFSNIVSWLALYHIPDRKVLLKKLFYILKDDGFFFTEDFFLRTPLSKHDEKLLSDSFQSNHLVKYDQYLNELKYSGFQMIDVLDLSHDWILFTKKRYIEFRKNIKSYKKIHGNAASENVLKFYNLANKLLTEKKIGGIRFICKKAYSNKNTN